MMGHTTHFHDCGCRSFVYEAEIARLKEANAELLAALEEMTDEIVKYGFAKATSPMAAGARATIAKAKGETK